LTLDIYIYIYGNVAKQFSPGALQTSNLTIINNKELATSEVKELVYCNPNIMVIYKEKRKRKKKIIFCIMIKEKK